MLPPWTLGLLQSTETMINLRCIIMLVIYSTFGEVYKVFQLWMLWIVIYYNHILSAEFNVVYIYAYFHSVLSFNM